jgi:hypothetical protein
VPKGPKSGKLKTRKGRASLKTRKGRTSFKTRKGLVQGKNNNLTLANKKKLEKEDIFSLCASKILI